MKTLIQRLKPKDKKGVALILALMLMTALSLLTITSFEILTGSIGIARNHKDDLQSLYVAEAGIEDAILQLRFSWSVSSTSGSLDGNTYTLTVTTVSADIKNIESQGTAGIFQRTLIARVKKINTVEYAPLQYSVAVMYWREKEM